jgi:ribose/xylose/arabinose/galactoside ABC-type transport system permease subunit
MYIGVLGSADPNTGTDWLITSFAVPIIGGTALVGGEAPAFGCLVAGAVIAAINDVLIVLNVSTYAVELGEGVLIFVAVISAGLIRGALGSENGARTETGSLLRQHR